jgi:hypothetical protein
MEPPQQKLTMTFHLAAPPQPLAVGFKLAGRA